MSSTYYPGKVLVDELVVLKSMTTKQAETEDGAELTGVIVKAAAPTTSNEAAIGTLWVKTDASAPKVYICVANGTTATWKELTLATS